MYHVFGEKEAEEKFVRCLRQGNVYVGIGSQDYMRKLLEANFNPEWHDPSKFKWNDSQPTSRWTTSRLLELRDKERKMDK